MANDDEIAGTIVSYLETWGSCTVFTIQRGITGDLPTQRIIQCLIKLCDIGVVTNERDNYFLTASVTSSSDLPAERNSSRPTAYTERRVPEVSSQPLTVTQPPVIDESPYMAGHMTASRAPNTTYQETGQIVPRTDHQQIVSRAAGQMSRAAGQVVPRPDHQIVPAAAGQIVPRPVHQLVPANQADDEMWRLLTALKESKKPLKAHELAKIAGIKDKKTCNKLLYILEGKHLAGKLPETALWQIAKPLEVETISRLSIGMCSEIPQPATETPPLMAPPGEGVECDCPNRGPGCNHYQVNNYYVQVGDTNNITINNLQQELHKH